MRRNRRPGFLAIPHELDDLPIFDGDLALKGVFFLLCHWANHANGIVRWKRIEHELARGEVVTSSNELAAKTGLSRKVIRRCIETLQQESMIGFRQKITKGQADAKKGQAKGQAETVYIINNYDGLFGVKQRNGPSKGPSSPRKGAKLDDSLPLYGIKNNTHTQGRDGGVCEPSSDDGKPAETSQTPPNSSFLEHPIVIAWNTASDRSKLERVSEVTPDRLRALEEAFRFRSDPRWWEVSFGRAAKPLKIHGASWLPNFDQCLELERAVRYYETAQKSAHLKPVPPPQGDTVGSHTGDGVARAMPTRPIEPRTLLKPGDLLRQFRESLE